VRRLLDLFCGAGGASVGYFRAGFAVTGVDHKRQRNFPYKFLRMDAFVALRALDLGEFDFIHASPPCQAYTMARTNGGHPDLVGRTREALQRSGRPWVIENVPGAPMRADLMLCGSMFGLGVDGYMLRRHRWFEFSAPELAPEPPAACDHTRPALPIFGHSPNGDFMLRNGGGVEAPQRKRGMQITWMNRNELAQAIPPDFTEWIGGHL
jgi:DNA (cytosine-5)-methyltransferase 1